MKKYLLPEVGKFYKANLHMHTIISDGRMTLEETKKEYLKRQAVQIKKAALLDNRTAP